MLCRHLSRFLGLSQLPAHMGAMKAAMVPGRQDHHRPGGVPSPSERAAGLPTLQGQVWAGVLVLLTPRKTAPGPPLSCTEKPNNKGRAAVPLRQMWGLRTTLSVLKGFLLRTDRWSSSLPSCLRCCGNTRGGRVTQKSPTSVQMAREEASPAPQPRPKRPGSPAHVNSRPGETRGSARGTPLGTSASPHLTCR